MNEITDGIIFNPILNEFYWASIGKGAWCNNKRIRVSKRKDLSRLPNRYRQFLLVTEFMKDYYTELDNISKSSAGIRRLGAAALDLAYVASGKIDGFWEKDLNLWDVSAQEC